VELGILSPAKLDDVRNWITQISTQIPDLLVSNITVNETHASFDISKRDKENIDPKETGLEIKKLTSSIKLPFVIKDGKVVGDDMWSWS
jgi:hypothetical protein